ncbi:unnamed protein product, partial [Porites lobata]
MNKTSHKGKGKLKFNCKFCGHKHEKQRDKSDVNTICQKHVRQHQVSPTTVHLNMWNNTSLKPQGETRLKVKNPHTSSESEIKFIVVPNGFTNLLGLNTIQELGFITINKECFISQVSTQQLGDLGEATLRIDESVPSKVLPCRK